MGQFALDYDGDAQGTSPSGLLLDLEGCFIEIDGSTKKTEKSLHVLDAGIARMFELRYANSLTLSEVRILRGLVAGKSLQEISSQDQVSYQTRRNQLRSIMEKADVSRQTVLISTCSVLLANKLMRPPEKKSAAKEKIGHYFDKFYKGTARLYSPRISGDQTLLISDVGPVGGTPIIHMHSGFFPVFPFPDNRSLLDELNLRIITPFRPGYFGQPIDWKSTPEERTADFVRTLAIFLEDFDLANSPVFAHAHGALSAVMLCKRLGTKVPRLTLNSAILPPALTQKPQKAHVRAQLALVEKLPKLGIQYFKLLAKSISNPAKLDETLERLFGDSEPDMAVLNAPSTKAWLHTSIYELGRCNLPGIVSEIMAQRCDWTAELRNLQMPITLLYGGQDKYTDYQELGIDVGGNAIKLQIDEDAGMISSLFNPKPMLQLIMGDHSIE